MYIRARYIAMAVIVALVICVVAYTVGKHSGCKEGKTVLVTDTLVMDVTHYDTVWRDNIAYKWRTVKDTVYVRGVGGDSIRAAAVSKEYAEDSLYKVWVSGVEPLALDSIEVYSKTTERTVTVTNTIREEDSRMRVFVFGGINAYGGTFRPSVGISLEPTRKLAIGAEIGLDSRDRMYYGVKIGYNINK